LAVATDYLELAGVIERFINGSSQPWEWEDYFLCKSCKDPFLISAQRRMLSISMEFPPASKGHYTGPEGIAVLRGLVEELRTRARQ
jgi:hypothetical protein